MPTVNKILRSLTLEDVNRISEHYLKGWRDLESAFGFRLRGLNNKREFYGLKPISDNESVEYRINYVLSHYSMKDILVQLEDYMRHHKLADERWSGIYLWDCRFGRDYVPIFKRIVGDDVFSSLSEKYRVEKLVETQLNEYGGVGIAGANAYAKMVNTVRNRYGVDNVMQSDEIKSKIVSPFADKAVHQKAVYNRWISCQKEIESGFLSGDLTAGKLVSRHERIIYYELVNRFGIKDVYFSYGIHPYDARYPYNCDFYIKSLDLFIENNADYSHGGHWYNPSNKDDFQRMLDMYKSGKRRTLKAVESWTVSDVAKREKAKSSGIKYLVFWDSGTVIVNKERIPRLKDFYLWLVDYSCDYDSFVRDYPDNTY